MSKSTLQIIAVLFIWMGFNVLAYKMATHDSNCQEDTMECVYRGL